jgi:hypothetical protein
MPAFTAQPCHLAISYATSPKSNRLKDLQLADYHLIIM